MDDPEAHLHEPESEQIESQIAVAREVGVAQTNLDVVANQPWLDAVGNPLSEAVRALFRNAGPAARQRRTRFTACGWAIHCTRAYRHTDRRLDNGPGVRCS